MRVLDFNVQSVREGDGLALSDGALTVNLDEIRKLVLADDRVLDVDVFVGNPGDDVRVIHVLDCVRPVCKRDGEAGVFPGVLCGPDTPTSAVTHRLRGVLVTAVGEFASDDAFLSQEEGIIDLRSGRAFSPLASDGHVVIAFTFVEGVDNSEREAAVRRGSAAVAERIASATLDLPTGREPEGAEGDSTHCLAHICEMSSFGPLFDTRVLGKSVLGILPTLVAPQNLVDGWVMSADYHYAGQRNLTCFYQDNPVERAIADLGLDAEIGGTILLPVSGSHEEKDRAAAIAANIADFLEADGAVITASAAGNAHLDVMFAVRACERRGIPTALVLVEFAGREGDDPGMVDTVPEASLIISTGNREELVSLPPCEHVIGGSALLDPDGDAEERADAAGAIEVPLRTMVGANNELGGWKIAAQAR